MDIAVLGIDLGKNSCSIFGLNSSGKVVLRRRMPTQDHRDHGCEALTLHYCDGGLLRRNNKIVQGFEKLPVVPALVAAPRPRCREYPQYNRPILVRHGCEHGRSSKNRLPISREKVIWESLYPILG